MIATISWSLRGEPRTIDHLTYSGCVVAIMSIRVLDCGVILVGSLICCSSPKLERVFFTYLWSFLLRKSQFVSPIMIVSFPSATAVPNISSNNNSKFSLRYFEESGGR